MSAEQACHGLMFARPSPEDRVFVITQVEERMFLFSVIQIQY